MMLEIDGGAPISVPVTAEPTRLPHRAGVLVDAYPEPDFYPAGVNPADSVATWLAQRNTARVLVACPARVSPARSMLALMVGRVLADQRDALRVGPRPVVTCGARPRCGWEGGEVIVPHPVTVFTRSTGQYRVVWEVTHERQIASWRASLTPVPAMSDG